MYQAIRAITAFAFIAIFLTACGGTSSGESTEGTGTSTTTTTTSSTNPDAVSGAQFYQQAGLLCVSCHGANGEGTMSFPDPINSPATCTTCTDVATLAAEIEDTMPLGGVDNCTGTTSGSCAHDIAVFMMETWIATAPPPPMPGVNVAPVSGISTSENGNTATIAFSLNTQPTPAMDVNITMASNDVTEGTINPANSVTLTFNDTNWNIAQNVLVTGEDDGDTDGNVQYMIVTDPIVSADTDYMNMNPDDVTITNTDNEVVIPAGITVNPVNGLTTSENVTSTTFSVVLDAAPAADVTIGITSSDTTEGTVMPSSLTFTNVNYDMAQMVTVTGVDDGVQDGAQNYMAVTAPATSADPEYAGLDASDVSVTNTDNEAGVPGVLVIPAMGLMTTEAGGTDTFTVVLQSMPNAAVTIAVASSNQLEGIVDLTVLNFDATNWDTAQTVTVTGQDDAVLDLDQAYEITLTTTSADPAYAAIAPISVSATNEDDEMNPFELGKTEYERIINGQSCASCHGAAGLGGVAANGGWPLSIAPGAACIGVDCNDQAALTTYIIDFMPRDKGFGGGDPADCDTTCADNIAQYMLNNFSVVP